VPLRAIKRLEGDALCLYLPQAIRQSYITWGNNTFELLVERHYDVGGKVLRTIGERIILTVNSATTPPYFGLAHHPLIRKYGMLSNEYLESVYLNKIDEREHGWLLKKTVQVREPIFAEREVQESDIQDPSK